MPPLITVRDHVAWAYANLARAHAALKDGAVTYRPVHHMIRARLFKGLSTGTMSIRSMFDDEREKLLGPRCCEHCGSTEALSVDHLFARSRSGSDDPQNLVLACRSCNSSKGAKDLLVWCATTNRFPSILLLRRYLKIVVSELEQKNMMDKSILDACLSDLPFDLQQLPFTYPPLQELQIAVAPRFVCTTTSYSE